ncbi:MAG: hypothetical protein Tsb0020_01620 [Haliangiales bacterium]
MCGHLAVDLGNLVHTSEGIDLQPPRSESSSLTKHWTPRPRFANYELVEHLGRGGMGVVYLARDTHLKRLVAIKFMTRHLDMVARERFGVEACAAARLQHPAVVTVYHVGELDGHPYIVSEYAAGTSLAVLPKPVPWREALYLGRGLARGLAAAHARGVLHRDIKPGNAIRTHSGEVKLLDFGLAKLLEDLGAEAPSPGGTDGARFAEDSVPRSPPGDANRSIDAVGDRARAEMLGAAADGESSDTYSLPDASGSWSDVAPERAEPAGLTRAGAVMGTPCYMSPEAWRGEPATPRSDVYSLGVVLYELCVGRPPYQGRTFAELREAVCNGPTPAVADVASGIDERFAAVIDHCLARAPEDRYASAGELWDALEDIGIARTTTVLPGGNPYRGLLPFDEAHRQIFFGRRTDVRVVVERLRTEPFVLVAGESGVGKSSLCRAGVIPLIKEGSFRDHRAWRAAVVVPGRRPMTALAAALVPHLEVDDEDDLTAPGALGRALRLATRERSGIMIFVDQLEELVTLGDPEQVAVLGEVLADAITATPGVRLLATVRGDYLTRLGDLPGLGSEIVQALQLLRPLGVDAIREAVVGPARATGVRFESDELVRELVASAAASQGGLPLLQFTLAELWEARDAARGVIGPAALVRIGGIEGVLARHADGVIQALPHVVGKAARRLLVDLVTMERTRDRRTEAELLGESPTARDSLAVKHLVRGRLLVARESEGETAYEIAHEALLSHWATLSGWLDNEADTRAVLQRVRLAASEWKRSQHSADTLWSDRQLDELMGIDIAAMPKHERVFVAASKRAVRRARWIRRGAVAAAVALVVAVYGVVQFVAGRDLENRVSRLRAKADAELARASSDARRVEEQRAHAFARFASMDRKAGETSWQRTAALAAEVERAHSEASLALEAAIGLDPSRHDIRSKLAHVLYDRALLAERDHQTDRVRDLLGRLAMYDDTGDLRRRWRAEATVSLTTVPAGARVRVERNVMRPGGARELVERSSGARLTTPVTGMSLEPGSYRLVIEAEGRAPVRYPVLLERGERLALQLELPSVVEVPDGFVYIPPGRFLFGTASRGDGRTFLDTAPLHERRTGAYLIARHEVTMAEWMTFLDALPDEQRSARLPRVDSEKWGSMSLDRVADTWQLTMTPTEHTYQARAGERVIYRNRTRHASQDWLRFPVTGISWNDASAYVAWLANKRRVPGARLCREDEWERAARGADARVFPHGDALAPGDANFDETYGRDGLAFGPDEVGSHPASRSPFGLDDMAGNALEMVASVLDQGELLIRGGAYYYSTINARAANRALIIEPTFRDLHTGFRVCADIVPGAGR